MNNNRTLKTASLSLMGNLLYAVGNVFLGVTQPSAWFFTLGIYYFLLSIMRFSVLVSRKKDENAFMRISTGVMLMILSIPLLSITILSAVKERGKVYHEILMITIALYAFTKITLAIINLIKAKRHGADATKTLGSISFADGVVSIASLQRSMLVSFDGMTGPEIRIFNILTGAAVCITVFIIGLAMTFKPKNNKLDS